MANTSCSKSHCTSSITLTGSPPLFVSNSWTSCCLSPHFHSIDCWVLSISVWWHCNNAYLYSTFASWGRGERHQWIQWVKHTVCYSLLPKDWVTIDYKHTSQSIHSTQGRSAETYPTTLSHGDWDLPVHAYWSTGWDMNPCPLGLKRQARSLSQWKKGPTS